MEKLKSIIILILSAALSFFLIKGCVDKDTISQKEIALQTFKALNDSLTITLNKKDSLITYQKSVILMTPKEIIKRNIYISNPKTKEFVESLVNEKDLVAASQTTIIIKDTIEKEVPLYIEDCLDFDISDTKGNMEYTLNFKCIENENPKINLSYFYNIDLETKVTKTKKEYLVEFKTNDANAIITDANFLLLPKNDEKKFKKSMRYIAPIISFGLGVYVGNKLDIRTR